jgi:thiol-disulfide isomerase/thioredoxin
MPNSARRRVLLTVMALLAAASGPAIARRHDPDATPLKTVFLTKAPPDFLFDLGDGPQYLHDLAGKPVIVNFWDTYCEPCQAELGAFAKIAPTYGQSVGVLTVNDETAGKAQQYLQQRGYHLPLIEDPARRIFALYSILPIPVTVIVARTGVVSKVIVGEVDWDELHADIDAELAPPHPLEH